MRQWFDRGWWSLLLLLCGCASLLASSAAPTTTHYSLHEVDVELRKWPGLVSYLDGADFDPEAKTWSPRAGDQTKDARLTPELVGSPSQAWMDKDISEPTAYVRFRGREYVRWSYLLPNHTLPFLSSLKVPRASSEIKPFTVSFVARVGGPPPSASPHTKDGIYPWLSPVMWDERVPWIAGPMWVDTFPHAAGVAQQTPRTKDPATSAVYSGGYADACGWLAPPIPLRMEKSGDAHSVSQWAVYTYTADAGGYVTYHHNAQRVAGIPSCHTPTSICAGLRSQPGQTGGFADIAAMLIFDRALQDTAVNRLHAYLVTRYGIRGAGVFRCPPLGMDVALMNGRRDGVGKPMTFVSSSQFSLRAPTPSGNERTRKPRLLKRIDASRYSGAHRPEFAYLNSQISWRPVDDQLQCYGDAIVRTAEKDASKTPSEAYGQDYFRMSFVGPVAVEGIAIQGDTQQFLFTKEFDVYYRVVDAETPHSGASNPSKQPGSSGHARSSQKHSLSLASVLSEDGYRRACSWFDGPSMYQSYPWLFHSMLPVYQDDKADASMPTMLGSTNSESVHTRALGSCADGQPGQFHWGVRTDELILVPRSWHGAASLRVEVFACQNSMCGQDSHRPEMPRTVLFAGPASTCALGAMCKPEADGAYACGACARGFGGNGHVECMDVDECSQGSVCGDNARCDNTVGSYRCVCKPGFAWNPTTADRTGPDSTPQGSCEDINECEMSMQSQTLIIDSSGGTAVATYPCDAIATCHNSNGGVTCKCPNGYQGDGFRVAGGSGCVAMEAGSERGEKSSEKPSALPNKPGEIVPGSATVTLRPPSPGIELRGVDDLKWLLARLQFQIKMLSVRLDELEEERRLADIEGRTDNARRREDAQILDLVRRIRVARRALKLVSPATEPAPMVAPTPVEVYTGPSGPFSPEFTYHMQSSVGREAEAAMGRNSQLRARELRDLLRQLEE